MVQVVLDSVRKVPQDGRVRLPTFRSWWGNKPKPIRSMVIVGAAAFLVLLALSLVVDATDIKGSIPGLPDFLWNVTTLTLLGTVGIAVLDDLRRAASSWRILQANEKSLAAAISDLLTQTWALLGCDRELTTVVVGLPHKQVMRLTSWFQTVRQRQYEAAYGTGLDGVLPIRSWQGLREALLNNELRPPDEQLLTEAADVSEVERSIDSLQARLTTLAHPEASAVSLVQVDSVRATLPGLAEALGEYRLWMASLPPLETNTEWPSDRDARVGLLVDGERDVVRSMHLASKLESIFGALGMLCDVLNYELDNGWPHPYRG